MQTEQVVMTVGEAVAQLQSWHDNYSTLDPKMQLVLGSVTRTLNCINGAMIGPHPAIGIQEGQRINQACALATPVILVSSVHRLTRLMEEFPEKRDDAFHAMVQAGCMVTHALEGEARKVIREIVPTDLWRTIDVKILLTHDLFGTAGTRADLNSLIDQQPETSLRR